MQENESQIRAETNSKTLVQWSYYSKYVSTTGNKTTLFNLPRISATEWIPVQNTYKK